MSFKNRKYLLKKLCLNKTIFLLLYILYLFIFTSILFLFHHHIILLFYLYLLVVFYLFAFVFTLLSLWDDRLKNFLKLFTKYLLTNFSSDGITLSNKSFKSIRHFLKVESIENSAYALGHCLFLER